jgi:Tol biopolymer transport system component
MDGPKLSAPAMSVVAVALTVVSGLIGCSAAVPGTAALVPAPTSTPRQLTFVPGDDFAPAWTPDGRSLVFVSDQQGGWNLWLLELGSATPRALTFGQFQYTNPFVLPDGRSIAVASDRGSATRAWTDLWVLTLEGSQERRLISESPTVKEFAPAISPDGRWLAYLDLPMNRPPRYRVVLMELPAGLPRVLTEDRVVFSPIRFSPDSRWILYTASTLGSSDVWTIGVDGAGARALTMQPSSEVAGDYSPDGTTIAFVSNQSGADELWLMEPQGRQARQLTRDGATASLPAFSPDSAQIAYTSTKSGNQDIWLIGSGLAPRP